MNLQRLKFYKKRYLPITKERGLPESLFEIVNKDCSKPKLDRKLIKMYKEIKDAKPDVLKSKEKNLKECSIKAAHNLWVKSTLKSILAAYTFHNPSSTFPSS